MTRPPKKGLEAKRIGTTGIQLKFERPQQEEKRSEKREQRFVGNLEDEKEFPGIKKARREAEKMQANRGMIVEGKEQEKKAVTNVVKQQITQPKKKDNQDDELVIYASADSWETDEESEMYLLKKKTNGRPSIVGVSPTGKNLPVPGKQGGLTGTTQHTKQEEVNRVKRVEEEKMRRVREEKSRADQAMHEKQQVLLKTTEVEYAKLLRELDRQKRATEELQAARVIQHNELKRLSIVLETSKQEKSEMLRVNTLLAKEVEMQKQQSEKRERESQMPKVGGGAPQKNRP